MHPTSALGKGKNIIHLRSSKYPEIMNPDLTVVMPVHDTGAPGGQAEGRH